MKSFAADLLAFSVVAVSAAAAELVERATPNVYLCGDLAMATWSSSSVTQG